MVYRNPKILLRSVFDLYDEMRSDVFYLHLSSINPPVTTLRASDPEFENSFPS